MWSDRKQQEDNRTSPASARAEAASPRPAAASVADTSAGESRSVAVIGKGMVIKGQVKSGEHMHVAGEIDGSLYLAGFDLTLTADSKVRADVTAREVDISGTIQGNVDATRKITVRKGGRLIGDLRTPGIVIEDGAYFKGSIEIVTRDARANGDQASLPLSRTAANT